MLRSVLSHLPQEALRRTTVLLWNNTAYERLSLDLRVHVIHYPRTTWELEQLADTFDVVIWGGGAILDDKQFDNNPANFNTGNIFIRLNELMLARRKQVWCLGLSCNTSFSKREYLSHLLNIVSHSQHFSLRDPFSFDLLVSVGMPKEHLSRCEDLVFGLPELNAIATTIRKSPPTKLEPTQQKNPFTLGFALMNIGTLVDSYTETIQNALTSSARFMNKPVRGLLIPSFGPEDYDSELNIEICHRLQERGLPVEVAPYTLSITKSPLAECDAVVCYKYHAALIAATMGIPVLAVILTQHPHYANKMQYLAQLGGFEKWALTSDEFKDNLDETMRRFLMQLPRPSLPATIYQQTNNYLDKVCAALGNS